MLDILIERVSSSELRVLVFKVLGPQAWHNLCGSSHTEKCIDLMENIERREIEDVLVQQLGLLRPDIDLHGKSSKVDSTSSLPISPRVALEQDIRQAYTIIREYESIRISSDRPEERLRAEKIVKQQWNYIQSQLQEYILRYSKDIPQDILDIANYLGHNLHE